MEMIYPTYDRLVRIFEFFLFIYFLLQTLGYNFPMAQVIDVVMNDRDMGAFVFGIFQRKKFLALKKDQYDLVCAAFVLFCLPSFLLCRL